MRSAPTSAAPPDRRIAGDRYGRAMSIDATVLRVFTDSNGNFGNPLGVVDAGLVQPDDRQRLSTQLGYSETRSTPPGVRRAGFGLPVALSTMASNRLIDRGFIAVDAALRPGDAAAVVRQHPYVASR